jgi:sugar lactone lactonase YvrE
MVGLLINKSEPEPAFVGHGLMRPECVVAHESGYLFTSDWTGAGGISIIAPNGNVRRVLGKNAPEPLRPNGIALEQGGSFLLAHLGSNTGGVYRLWPDGLVEPVLTHLNGIEIPPSNFPLVDAAGQLWLSISTMVVPRSANYRPGANTGRLIVSDGRGPRVVAEGLGYANEFAISENGNFLFVNETFGRRTKRFAITARGELAEGTVIGQYGPGTFPDGIALDSAGGIWITSIISNRVIRLDPDGSQEIVIEDADANHLGTVEKAFEQKMLGRAHLDNVRSRWLKNISSIAFGGPDLKTAYLGCLLGDQIAKYELPVAGLRPPHFSFDIDPLLKL